MTKRDYYEILGIGKDASAGAPQSGLLLIKHEGHGKIRALPPALVETLGGVLL